MEDRNRPLDNSVLLNAYFRMFDAVPDALVIADEAGSIRLLNRMAERIFGYERDELLGTPIEQLAAEQWRHADVQPQMGRTGELRVRAGRSCFELQGRRKDGSEFPLEVSSSALETEAGWFVLCALRDITRRKEAELGSSLLAAIVDSSEDAIFSTALDGHVTSWNRGATRMFGYEPEEMLGRSIAVLAQSPDASRVHQRQMARLLQGEKLKSWEGPFRRKDGVEIWSSVRLSAIRDGSDKTLGVSVTARDITAQRLADQRALREDRRLRSAVDSIQGMFALFDTEDRLVVCNSSFAKFFAPTAPEKIVGQRFDELLTRTLERAVFDDTQTSREALRQLWQGQRRAPATPFDLHTQDQRTLRVAERATPEGGIVTTIWDITEDQRRADELRSARLLADQANAAKSEFLASMSHELRTPLNAILGFAQLLLRDKKAPLGRRQLDQAAQIFKGGEHLLQLIDHVLDLARIETGGATMSLEPVSIGEVLQEVRATLTPMAARTEIRLELQHASHHVVADRTRLAQILMHLGSNAIKFGKPRGRVHFAVVTRSEDTLRINVSDDGQGIAYDEQPKLFQPFRRAGSGTVEGIGIGLFLCKRLATIMQGAIGFHSEPGVGSVFWIELPQHEGHPLPKVLPSGHRPVSEPPPNWQRLVVYIEDNPANLALMRSVLDELRHVELITAPTAEIGIELVRARKPDLVLMDINLPGMSGLTALARLRAWPDTREIPVVALSAAAMMRDAGRGEMAQFDQQLTKPINVDELTRTLEHYLAVPQTSSE